jgi:hypothetical protein
MRIEARIHCLSLFKWTSSREEHNIVSSVSRDGTNANMMYVYYVFFFFVINFLSLSLCLFPSVYNRRHRVQ